MLQYSSMILLSFLDLEKDAEILFSFLTKLFIIILVVVAIVYVAKVLMDKSYSIRQINVPDSFLKDGNSGPVIANRIYFRLQQIIERVNAMEHAKGYTTAAAHSDVSVDVAGMGMPVNGFIEMIGKGVGIQRSKKIDVDFFMDGNILVMLLRITGQKTERVESPVTADIGSAIKVLVLEAAEIILKFSNDEVLQTYYGLVEQIGEKQIKLAKYRFEIYKNNPAVEIKVIAAWAWGLCMLKRYPEAEVIIKEGIKKHKKAGRIYVIWGSLLLQTGKFEDALSKFNTALKEVDPKETKTRISNIYSSIGNCYGKLGQIEMALKYMEQSIQVEPNASRPYYTMALLKLAIKDEEGFYEALEKALEKGFQTANVLKNPNCTKIKDEPRMAKLLGNYKD